MTFGRAGAIAVDMCVESRLLMLRLGPEGGAEGVDALLSFLRNLKFDRFCDLKRPKGVSGCVLGCSKEISSRVAKL